MTTRIFEGRFNVRLNNETKVISLAKATDGKYSAQDAETVIATIIEGAKKHKATADRWSFYIKDVNQTLKDGENLKPAQLEKAVKAGFKPVIKAGKWGKPRLDMVNPEAPTAKQNDNIVLL
jgi:topoisomerase IA-like protein